MTGSRAPSNSPAEVSLPDATRLWLRIGLLSFGGPAAQIALMHSELVERRAWISESRFLHALNYCMLLPGPEAQQLAIYIGWLLHRTRGGIIAGVLFVLPGFLTILLLSALYVRFQSLPSVAASFFGLKAVVLAVVVEAVIRIGRRALASRFLAGVAAAAFVAICFFDVPFPWIIAAAAVLALAVRRMAPSWLGNQVTDTTKDSSSLVDRMLETGELAHTRPSVRRAFKILIVCALLWFVPVLATAALLGWPHVLTREGVFFSQTAVLTFGGAYAVLAYVTQRAVEDFGWLRPGEMLDGLALAETTPGPLILVVQFVGFLAAFRNAAPLDPWTAAVLGALMAAWVTFVPCFLFIFVGAPYVERIRTNRNLNAALTAITAAVVGVILNLSLWFALRTLFAGVETHRIGPITLDVPVWSTLDAGALVLTAAALVAVLRFRLSLALTLIGGAILGAFWWWLRAMAQ